MKIEFFIEKLQEIRNKYGEDVEVVMADGIPVVDPVYLEDFLNKKVVVITDQTS